MRGTGAVLLQREVPEHVNEAVAAAAAAAGVPVIQVRACVGGAGGLGMWGLQAPPGLLLGLPSRLAVGHLASNRPLTCRAPAARAPAAMAAQPSPQPPSAPPSLPSPPSAPPPTPALFGPHRDAGGEDRPLSALLLRHLDYLAPNESELQRLTGLPTGSEEQALAAAASLTARGARAVLVTLAERGALLLRADGTVLRQGPLPVPGGVVADGTAAGDAFRAGFAVALVEGLPLQACLRFAAAAGAVAVSRMGAVPSLPTRAEVELLLAGAAAGGGGPAAEAAEAAAAEQAVRGASGSCAAERAAPAPAAAPPPPRECPYQFAARLNSMRERRDLALPGDEPDDLLGWIARQGRASGLSLVDLNYPQHLEGRALGEVQAALGAAGLAAGAVCTRFPAEFRLGAFTNPDAGLRRGALGLALEACRWAARLGARDLIVWPQYDGCNYHFHVGGRRLGCRCCPWGSRRGALRKAALRARCWERAARGPAAQGAAAAWRRSVPPCAQGARRAGRGCHGPPSASALGPRIGPGAGAGANVSQPRTPLVDYQAAWDHTVEAFRNLSGSCPPGVRVSLEFKPIDVSARFSLVPSTGAALLLARQVDRPNFGLTWVAGAWRLAGPGGWLALPHRMAGRRAARCARRAPPGTRTRFCSRRGVGGGAGPRLGVPG
jgi:hypothetical protein